jgi:hypothetical protein
MEKTTKKSSGKRETVAVKKQIAKALYQPEGKNGYYKGDMIINSFDDLVGAIDNFTDEEEARWVAAWIEYLGDAKLAQQILEKPGNLKKLVLARHKQLSPYRPS